MKRASGCVWVCSPTLHPEGTMNARLKFDTVSCEPHALVTRAQVQLSSGSTHRTGVATGLTATVTPLQIVAEATSDAVEGFIQRADVIVDFVAEVSAVQRPLMVVTRGLRDSGVNVL